MAHRARQIYIVIVSRQGFATHGEYRCRRENNVVAFTQTTLVLLKDVLAGDVELKSQRRPKGPEPANFRAFHITKVIVRI